MAHHNLSPNIVLGYHGCEKRVGMKVLRGATFQPSQNDYDWLGRGIYFWESNPDRALSFAREQARRGRIKEPFVVGAAITLGNCIDTLNETSIQAVKLAHQRLREIFKSQNTNLPKNTGGPDKLLKRLDCAVVMTLHEMLEESGLPPADSLRGLYHEGDPIYRTSSFYAKSHVQICVVNKDCIKGVFLPRLARSPAKA
jgi:hypothetical protein